MTRVAPCITGSCGLIAVVPRQRICSGGPTGKSAKARLPSSCDSTKLLVRSIRRKSAWGYSRAEFRSLACASVAQVDGRSTLPRRATSVLEECRGNFANCKRSACRSDFMLVVLRTPMEDGPLSRVFPPIRLPSRISDCRNARNASGELDLATSPMSSKAGISCSHALGSLQSASAHLAWRLPSRISLPSSQVVPARRHRRGRHARKRVSCGVSPRATQRAGD